MEHTNRMADGQIEEWFGLLLDLLILILGGILLYGFFQASGFEALSTALWGILRGPATNEGLWSYVVSWFSSTLDLIYYGLWLTATIVLLSLGVIYPLVFFYEKVLEAPLQTLHAHGLKTPVGRITAGDVTEVIVISGGMAAGAWYTQPFGPVESFLRSLGAVVSLIVLILLISGYCRVVAAIEPDGDSQP